MIDSGDYKIAVSADGMQGYLTLLNPDLRDNFTLNDIRSLLTENGITVGIRKDILVSLVVSPEFGEPILVARGIQPPRPILDRLTYTFLSDNSLTIEKQNSIEHELKEQTELDDDGRINLRIVKRFNNVREGEILAHPTVITDELCGVNVLGQRVEPVFGEGQELLSGRGTLLDEESGTITAETSGHVTVHEGRIRVIDRLEIPGDIDYSIGNIDFIGSIRVGGNLHPGFELKSGGNLTVVGNIDRGKVFCGEDLEVMGNIFGAGECSIEVLGNAKLTTVDQSEVTVYGNLTVRKYIRHSTVRVGNDLKIADLAGNLVGGETHVLNNVDVPSIGSKMATSTRLNVGSNPFHVSDKEELKTSINKLTHQIELLQKAIEQCLNQPEDDTENVLTSTRMQTLLQAKSQSEDKLKERKEELKRFYTDSSELRRSTVSIRGVVYPGVMFRFRGKMLHKTMDAISGVAFYEDGVEVRMRNIL